MSLLTNYEGLRHQIERLVRENEELKKLVRLIRENQELKSAIKTQAGGLNISGLTSGLGEMAASPSQRQGVFLPPSPAAAANEQVLEEVGVVALAPLADMLSSPQPSPAVGSFVSPMMGPLNTLLSNPVPVSQSSPLTSLLTGPLSSHLASPLAMTPGGTLTSLSLMAPMAAPLGVSQSLLASPTGGLIVPEAPGVRLADTLQGGHSGPLSSAGAGSTINSKGNGVPGRGRGLLELERKMAHRKTSKFPDSTRESKQLAWERLVGEIAFQLDRRILSSIFPERVRLYGFTVSNIPEKIIQASLNPSDHKLDEELCQTLTQRYVSIMNRLQSLGYNGRVHPALTEQLVNAYGILRERPELAASEGGSYTVDFLQRVLVETVHPSMLTDALLLLSCLNQLAHDDGKPMFIW
uniref:Spermatosis and centriole associated 1 n=1 Tax=Urocitellus parryii TaxID=9999 RepID=A0A8D2ILE0_UROPR